MMMNSHQSDGCRDAINRVSTLRRATLFYQPQITLSGGGEICPSACMTYTFNLAGEKPFELMYQVNANGMVTEHVLITDTSTVSILICPIDYGLTSGTIDIIPISSITNKLSVMKNLLFNKEFAENPSKSTLNLPSPYQCKIKF
jgi:hypothetical protein